MFGGSPSAKYCCFIVNDSGKVVRDLSEGSLIPGAMCIGACVKRRGKVYAAGKRRVRGQAHWGVKVFDGKEWKDFNKN